ncbi:hypothetical protein ACHAW6_011465 [Cyclotella cf. meneghiniana]
MEKQSFTRSVTSRRQSIWGSNAVQILLKVLNAIMMQIPLEIGTETWWKLIPLLPMSYHLGLKIATQVALSTTEAEYIAIDAIPVIELLDELKRKNIQVFCTPPIVYCKVFEGTLELSCLPKLCLLTKRINICHHHFWEHTWLGLIKILPISTDDQIADASTKPLAQNTLYKHWHFICNGVYAQLKEKLTTKRHTTATIFVHHFSRLYYVHLMALLSSQETIDAKQAFEQYAADHGVHIKHKQCHIVVSMFTFKMTLEKEQSRISPKVLRPCYFMQNKMAKCTASCLWPYAVRMATYTHNTALVLLDGNSHIEQLSGVIGFCMKNNHILGVQCLFCRMTLSKAILFINGLLDCTLLSLEQIDFIQSNPLAPIETEMYMEFPKGIETCHGNSKDHVIMLGCNPSGQNPAGGSLMDKGVFYHDEVIFIVYVDDGIFLGPVIAHRQMSSKNQKDRPRR